MKLFGSDSEMEAPGPTIVDVPGATAASIARTDEALDTLAEILRVLGRYNLYTGADESANTRQQCEAWARHVLLCAPAPGIPPTSTVPGRRYWSEARRFATRLRMDEFERVAASMGELRRAVWAVVDGLTELLTEGTAADDRVVQALDQLKGTLHERSPENLRQAVESAVTELTRIVHERKHYQQTQLQVLGERMSALAEELQEVRRESSTDDLTHLFNRRPFEDYLVRTAHLRQSFQQPACLLLVDIDGFKQVNDQYGHLAGDTVLQALADCMARTFPRRSDLAARFGGDQFGIILSGTRLRDGAKLTERFLATVRELEVPIQTLGEPIRFRVSVGVSEAGEREDAEDWLRRTNEALCEAKRTGRDRLWCAEAPSAAGGREIPAPRAETEPDHPTNVRLEAARERL